MIHTWIFYSSWYFLKNFSLAGRKKIIKTVGLLLISLGVFMGLDYLYYFHFAPFIRPDQNRILDLRYRLIDALVWYNQFFLYALGYYFAQQAIKKERLRRIAEQEKKNLLEEKLQLELANHHSEKIRLQTEYAYLRAQISPHFLHNVLNFFYSKSLPYSPELSESILTLSGVMRYALQNEEDSHGMVLLDKEVEHLQNVIKINQLRFNNKLQIRFTITGNLAEWRIIPLVLITLIENSFKHGELTDPKHPVTILLQVDDSKKQLYFRLHNRKKKGPKELSNGIGLDNTRRRLGWAYKDEYRFLIHEDEEFYTTELFLPAQVGYRQYADKIKNYD
jgi:LytS/YehU family sensor histidine kinase